MHDLDRAYEQEELEELEEMGAAGGTGEQEELTGLLSSLFGEVAQEELEAITLLPLHTLGPALTDRQETELASALMEVGSEQELEFFLRDLIGSAAQAAGSFIRSDTGKALGNVLRRATKSALPIVGRAVGQWVSPGRGGAVGARLGKAAGVAFGLELEGLSGEDREFEVARALVRFADSAARLAAILSQQGLSGSVLLRQSLVGAASRHAPGLLGGARVPRWRKRRMARRRGRSAMSEYAGGGGFGGEYEEYEEVGGGGFGGEYEEYEEVGGGGFGGEYEEYEEVGGGGFGGQFEEYEEVGGGGGGAQFEEFEMPFNEMTEQELASEFLEITNEQELDQFLGRLIRRATRGVGRFVKSTAGRALIGGLKGIGRKLLPIAGGAIGSWIAPGVGTALGTKLGTMAGKLFEFEYEGGDQEFEYERALRFVRLGGSAARMAARGGRGAPPQAVAQRAIMSAAQSQLRMLGGMAGAGRGRRRPARPMRPMRPMGAGPSGQQPRRRTTGPVRGPVGGIYADSGMAMAGGGGGGGGASGTWTRRGNTLTIHGV